MSETLTLHDRAALVALSALITKHPPLLATPSEAAHVPRAIALGALDYADAFAEARAERRLAADEQSLGAELRLLRRQRDEALMALDAVREALRPFVGFSGYFQATGGLPGGVASLRAKYSMTETEFAKACRALKQLIGDEA